MIADDGEDLGEGEHSFNVGGFPTGTASMEISVEIPQEAENRSTSRSSYYSWCIPSILLHIFLVEIFCHLLCKFLMLARKFFPYLDIKHAF